MKKYVPYILGIFGIDLFTKLLAYFLLPFDQDILVVGHHLEFHLVYNTTASGSKAASIVKNTSNPNIAFFIASLFGIISGLSLYFLKDFKFKLWHKILIISLFLILYLTIQTNISNYQTYHFNDYFISWFSKLGAMALSLGFFAISTDKWLKVILISYFSCGLGNLINHFYPPFAIIDFILSPILFKIFHLSICNVADILAEICKLFLLCRLIIIGLQKVYSKRANNQRNI